ncbi:hypothetical protein LEP1GSC050_1981 [Leptospira broomii serovar Hurstbridge str. 5399]|uniref:Uncharacterized protein n=1 Tax=Leptospira broomii serovar Hurstbridge str. 5399 TaxID=1049789 RepID=T0GFS5_9LEPT|nr:hypothetical protein LEP1GSC050_1981 [Leptospira broomii serovar Hurstbridge str. 5399]
MQFVENKSQLEGVVLNQMGKRSRLFQVLEKSEGNKRKQTKASTR